MVSEIDKYRLSSPIEVLCFMFSRIEFHNIVVDRMKDFLGNVDFMGWNYSFKRFVSVVWISS